MIGKSLSIYSTKLYNFEANRLQWHASDLNTSFAWFPLFYYTWVWKPSESSKENTTCFLSPCKEEAEVSDSNICSFFYGAYILDSWLTRIPSWAPSLSPCPVPTSSKFILYMIYLNLTSLLKIFQWLPSHKEKAQSSVQGKNSRSLSTNLVSSFFTSYLALNSQVQCSQILRHQNHLEDLLNHRLLGSIPRTSDLVGLE